MYLQCNLITNYSLKATLLYEIEEAWQCFFCLFNWGLKWRSCFDIIFFFPSRHVLYLTHPKYIRTVAILESSSWRPGFYSPGTWTRICIRQATKSHRKSLMMFCTEKLYLCLSFCSRCTHFVLVVLQLYLHHWTQILCSLSYYFNTLSEFCWWIDHSDSSAFHVFDLFQLLADVFWNNL